MRIAIAILGLTLSTLSIHAQSITTNKAKGMTQKEQVVALLKSIETGDTAPVAFINAAKSLSTTSPSRMGSLGLEKP